MLRFLAKLFDTRTEQELAYDYLTESHNLEDLERRQRQLSKGEAPFQTRNKIMAGHL